MKPSQKTRRRCRRAQARRKFAFTLAVLIVAGLLAGLMPWSGTTPEAKLKKMLEEEKAKIEAELGKKFEENNAELKASFEAANEEIEKLNIKLQNQSDENLVAFKLNCNILQNAFNDCIKNVDAAKDAEPETSEKMKAALKTIITQLIERI